MSRFGFKMYLIEGQEAEYKKRHDEIWPELVDLLREYGVHEYSIFLDEETNTLFALQNRRQDHRADDIGESPIMQRWWKHMGGLLKTHADGSLIVVPLREMFHMA